MAKSKKQIDSLLQENGRGYVAGAWLTPLQSKGLAFMLTNSIVHYESLLPTKPSPTQKQYLTSLQTRLEAAELIAGQLRS